MTPASFLSFLPPLPPVPEPFSLGSVLALAAVSLGLMLVTGMLGGIFWRARREHPEPDGDSQCALLAVPAGEMELSLWLDRLQATGIWAGVRRIGDDVVTPGPYSQQIWVRAKDETRARHALGLVQSQGG
jgi:hypothetical protein